MPDPGNSPSGPPSLRGGYGRRNSGVRGLWLVARHEYRRMVLRRAFLITTLAIPLGMAALIAVVIAVEKSGQDRSTPVGYLDYAGVLALEQEGLETPSLPRDGIEIRSFPDLEAGQAALERREIQAFFVLPAGYPANLQAELYYLTDPPSREVWREFDDFVRANLVAQFPAEVQTRLLEGADVTVEDIATGRQFSESGVVNIILPFVATFVFFIATMMSSGYMLQAVADEKESRTMELMITSMTPLQLIAGKVIGLLAAALTQLTIYGTAAIIGIVVAAPYVPELQRVVVPWDYLGMMLAFFLPTYLLVSAVMVAIGSAVGEIQQGQQVAGILSMLFTLPIFLSVVIIQNPGHPIALFFTFFPSTSFITISLRWGLSSVPWWQIGVAWVLLDAAASLMVWVAARIFRVGMLRYGQPLSLRRALAEMRGLALPKGNVSRAPAVGGK